MLSNPATFDRPFQKPIYEREIVGAASPVDAQLLCWAEELWHMDGGQQQVNEYMEAMEQYLQNGKHHPVWCGLARQNGWPVQPTDVPLVEAERQAALLCRTEWDEKEGCDFCVAAVG